jgi:hypothetical protein
LKYDRNSNSDNQKRFDINILKNPNVILFKTFNFDKLSMIDSDLNKHEYVDKITVAEMKEEK